VKAGQANVNLNRFLKYINYLIALLLAAAAGIVWWFAFRVLPQTSGAVAAPVSARTVIARDANGVPHIEAASDDDAWFAQGYVHAQDRLFQMEFTRRQAAGELAAVFGPSAVESDLEMRRLRMPHAAADHARALPPEDLRVLSAYARGVNHFLQTHRSRLPVEFSLARFDPAPWRVSDTVLVGLQMFRTLTSSWRDELLKTAFLQQGDPAKVRALFPTRTGSEPLPGSNAWVLAGSRTASGKPVLANDPHLSFSLPGIWYQVDIRTPTMHVAGVSVPGAPSVIIGHNQYIAWGMTNLHFDVQDLYVERINPPAGFFVFQGQPLRLRQHREVILVRGGAKLETLVPITRHGAVLVNEPNRQLTLRWTATEPAIFQFVFASINRAKNWPEFRAALERFAGPGQNFVYADREGNIGYQAAGKLPIRRNWDGDVAAEGVTGSMEWDGYIPFAQLPSLFNPPSGIIVTANQNPFPESYPYRVTGNFAPPYRAQRIRSLLEKKSSGWKPGDMTAVQTDVYSAFSHFLAGQLIQVHARAGKRNPSLTEPARLLNNWNGEMKAGHPAPLILTLAFQHLRKAVADHASGGNGQAYELSMGSAVIEKLLRDKPANWFPDYDQLLLRSFMDAINEGTKFYGPDVSKWDYGRFNELTLRNRVVPEIPFLGTYLRIGPVGMSGSSTTVKQTTTRLGPSMRMVIDLADFDNSILTLTTGQSGHPLSGLYTNRWDTYQSGGAELMPFSNVKTDPNQVLVLTANK
jgi:penicillin amidase